MTSNSPVRRSTVVVDLSRGSIKLAVAQATGEAVRFRGITRIGLPAEEVDQAEPDPAQIARLIRAEVDRRGWRGMPAACLLSGGATSTQSFLVPSMPAGELREALMLKLGEALHFDLDEACFDFRSVREFDGSGKKQVLTLAAAARKGAVQSAVAVLREAGLRPVAIGSAAESLANLVQHARLCREGEASIHVDMGSSSTILNLFDGRWPRFSREIDTAGEAFTRALMRPILTPRGAVRLTHAQAEEVAVACGCPRESVDRELPHGVRSSEVLPLMEPVVQRLTAEIRRSSDYLCSILERLQVDRIILSGRPARMNGLEAVLAENLNTNVIVTDPVARAKAHWRLAICDDDAPPLGGFAAILGYSLGNYQPINLLPREERVREVAMHISRVRKGAAPPAIAFGLCLAVAAIPVNETYRGTRSSLRQTVAEIDERLRNDASFVERRERTREAAEEILAARGPVPDFAGILKELAALLGPQAQLTSFSIERSEEELTAHFSVTTRGAQHSFETLVTQLSAALGSSPFFKDAHVVDAVRGIDDSDGRLEMTAKLVAARQHPWSPMP